MPRSAPRPLVALTTSEMRTKKSATPTRHGEPLRRELALGLTYPHAVECAGGIPVVVPPLPLDDVEPLLEHCSGLLLSGGPDIAPAVYGAEPHPETGPCEEDLDLFELALVRCAGARGMPILCICRGMQMLNVSRGGTLHQHLPDVVGNRIEHRQEEIGTKTTHWVNIEDASRLGQILGRTRTRVNSFHHQAIDRLGTGLTVTATASDGTIEAVEDPTTDFLIGVQWHAETLVGMEPQQRLFEAFVDACTHYESQQAPVANAA
jgi:putative glutamine amidotransferase